MGHALRLTDANFEQEVSTSSIPVLVDFWASWCPPCKMVEPVVEELAAGYDGRLKVGKLHVDQNPKMADRYQIMGVPTFALFCAGEVLQRRTPTALLLPGGPGRFREKPILRGNYGAKFLHPRPQLRTSREGGGGRLQKQRLQRRP